MRYWLPYIELRNLTVTVPENESSVNIQDLGYVISIKMDFSVGNENVNRSLTFGIDVNGNIRSI